MTEEYLTVSIYDLKTNFSKYLRALQRGDYKGLGIRRYRKIVAIMVTADGVKPAR